MKLYATVRGVRKVDGKHVKVEKGQGGEMIEIFLQGKNGLGLAHFILDEIKEGGYCLDIIRLSDEMAVQDKTGRLQHTGGKCADCGEAMMVMVRGHHHTCSVCGQDITREKCACTKGNKQKGENRCIYDHDHDSAMSEPCEYHN